MGNFIKGMADTDVNLTVSRPKESNSYTFIARQAYHYVRTIVILIVIIMVLVTSAVYAAKYAWWLSLLISIAVFMCGIAIAGVVAVNVYPPTRAALRVLNY